MTQLASPDLIPTDSPAASPAPTPQKQDLLLAFYRTGWEEMTWRRNAGYRTIILGLAYCGLLLAVVAFNRQMSTGVRACLAAVVAVATAFGTAYLASNYHKYMSAHARLVLIEQYLGAYDPDYLGPLGPLMPDDRRRRAAVPLRRDPVSFWSVCAFAAGGSLTAAAILMV